MNENQEQNSNQVFHPDMSIHEAMQLHPEAAEIFSIFHFGGCASCPVSKYETIRQVCMGHGVDLDEFMEKLNKLGK
jgi:hybrid cluster-associated redox disulfide protein